MQINRITVIKNQNYVTVNNTITRDKRVSLKAKGLMQLVLSLPPSWDFSIMGIVSITKEGKDAVATALLELREFGYCIFEQVREGGKFKGYNYTFVEVPEGYTPADLPKPDFPDTDKPDTDFPDTENPLQISKDKLNTKELNKEGGFSPKIGGKDRSSKTPSLPSSVLLWLEKMQIEITEAGAKMIAKRVTVLEAWEDTLEGWLASNWTKNNIDGQLSRYDKKVADGNYKVAPAIAGAELSDEEKKRKDEERKLIYGDT